MGEVVTLEFLDKTTIFLDPLSPFTRESILAIAKIQKEKKLTSSFHHTIVASPDHQTQQQ